jgi:Integrin alpha
MLGEDEEVVFNITVHNHGESAYESYMYVTHPTGLSFIGTGSEVSDFELYKL